ncbi:MAG: hypothetical protein ACRC33_14880 [Gemmataceae bacterium]
MAEVLVEGFTTEEAIQILGEEKVLRALGSEKLRDRPLQDMTAEQLMELARRKQAGGQ